MAEADVAVQTERVLQNLGAVLESAGSSLEHVVKTTVFLQHMSDFAAMNEVYARIFGDARPARSTVAVAALPLGALVEIEVVALVGEKLRAYFPYQSDDRDELSNEVSIGRS